MRKLSACQLFISENSFFIDIINSYTIFWGTFSTSCVHLIKRKGRTQGEGCRVLYEVLVRSNDSQCGVRVAACAASGAGAARPLVAASFPAGGTLARTPPANAPHSLRTRANAILPRKLL